MLRQIITPLQPNFTLQFPAEMIGKTIEIIAFELPEGSTKDSSTEGKTARINRIIEITKDSLVDLSLYKFDRNDANNFDE